MGARCRDVTGQIDIRHGSASGTYGYGVWDVRSGVVARGQRRSAQAQHTHNCRATYVRSSTYVRTRTKELPCLSKKLLLLVRTTPPVVTTHELKIYRTGTGATRRGVAWRGEKELPIG